MSIVEVSGSGAEEPGKLPSVGSQNHVQLIVNMHTGQIILVMWILKSDNSNSCLSPNYDGNMHNTFNVTA